MRKEVKALIVDDSISFLGVMQSMLRACGISNITTCGTGARGVDQFEEALALEDHFSLVFLDIMMPGMDGQETLRRMRKLEDETGIPANEKATIIMATSRHSQEDMMEAIIGGDSNDYLVKPFHLEELRGMLRRYGFSA